MKNNLYSLFIVILIAFIFSCSLKNDLPEIKYNSLTMSLINCDVKTCTCTFAKIMYPEISIDKNKESENSINRYIIDQLRTPLFSENLFNDVDGMITNFFDEYIQMKTDFNVYNIHWVLDKKIEVIFSL